MGAAIARLRRQLEGHPVAARLPADLPLAPMDELLMQQVLVNLLENAAKYTPAGSPIEITARAEDDRLTVEVADRGPGLPPERVRFHSERCRQVLPRQRRFGPAGRRTGADDLPRHRRVARREDHRREPFRRRRGVPVHAAAGRRAAPIATVAPRLQPMHMPIEGPRILVIEDEQEIRRFLRVSLAHHGYRLVEATTGREGVMQAASQQPDLVILDLGLPDIDGMEVIAQVRQWSQVPIVILSARGQEHEKVEALDAGADDYLTKPFSVVELLARLRVALRHAAQLAGEPGEPVFELGGLRVDLGRRQVFVDEQEIHLTPIEYRLLTTLVKYAGRVVTHRQLLKEVWGPDSVFETHYLRVYMTQLRRKIESDPAQPRFLLTEPGVGYRLASQ